MDSFNILYTTYYPRIYSTSLILLKNHSLSEECTQEAFLNAYKSIHTLKDSTKFGAWVASIATNLAIDIYKKNSKVINFDETELLDLLSNTKKTIQDTTLNKIENIEVSKELKEAISKLKPPLNQIIVLKYYWDLKDQEIAELLNIPLGTVKTSIFRAKKTLAKKLIAINKDYLTLVEGGLK